jgi:hypothetical protein
MCALDKELKIGSSKQNLKTLRMKSHYPNKNLKRKMRL